MITLNKYVLTSIALLISMYSQAQFASQAGLSGSTAIHKDSNLFIDWANSCAIKRGWLDIGDTTLGKVMFGDTIYALNKADGNVISLGDRGEAIYFLNNPIINGIGFDFAIFENGFRNPIDSQMAYLELAQVEVSNDGLTYYNFASVCNNDTSIQIAGVGEYMDARKVNNLAGKYIADYGTPFDLEELNGQFGLDINNIRFVKITDVVGSIQSESCTKDFYSRCINDPYPTPFPSGGFDLDAVGIIHQKFPTDISEIESMENRIHVYPNPSTGILKFKSKHLIQQVIVYSLTGKILMQQKKVHIHELDISSFAKGNYMIFCKTEGGHHFSKLVLKE